MAYLTAHSTDVVGDDAQQQRRGSADEGTFFAYTKPSKNDSIKLNQSFLCRDPSVPAHESGQEEVGKVEAEGREATTSNGSLSYLDSFKQCIQRIHSYYIFNIV